LAEERLGIVVCLLTERGQLSDSCVRVDSYLNQGGVPDEKHQTFFNGGPV
jgi:hypothetical protein